MKGIIQPEQIYCIGTIGTIDGTIKGAIDAYEYGTWTKMNAIVQDSFTQWM